MGELYLDLYEKSTKNSEEADRRVTINAFSWLLCAQRRLTSEEFLTAVSTTPQQKFNSLTKGHILDLCSYMVVFDPELDTFRFAHLSVREFLEQQPEFATAATNALAAETCLANVISADASNMTKDFLAKHGYDLSSLRSRDEYLSIGQYIVDSQGKNGPSAFSGTFLFISCPMSQFRD